MDNEADDPDNDDKNKPYKNHIHSNTSTGGRVLLNLPPGAGFQGEMK